MVTAITIPRLYPSNGPNPSAAAAGLRFGAKGTHTSRTMMFEELSALLKATRFAATRRDYAAAIIEMNCLAKATAASRRLTNQRIGELYVLDRAVPIYRVFRRLWDVQEMGRRLLALQCAIARDPLLAATVPAVLSLPPGAEFSRDLTASTLREAVGDRLNDSSLAKVVRNAASSWTQSEHLNGRTFKKRRLVTATTPTVAFALYLGHAIGFRGADLFNTAWMTLLDCTPSRARELALDAKRIGLIDLRMAGEAMELNLDRLGQVQGVWTA